MPRSYRATDRRAVGLAIAITDPSKRAVVS